MRRQRRWVAASLILAVLGWGEAARADYTIVDPGNWTIG